MNSGLKDVYMNGMTLMKDSYSPLRMAAINGGGVVSSCTMSSSLNVEMHCFLKFLLGSGCSHYQIKT